MQYRASTFSLSFKCLAPSISCNPCAVHVITFLCLPGALTTKEKERQFYERGHHHRWRISCVMPLCYLLHRYIINHISFCFS